MRPSRLAELAGVSKGYVSGLLSGAKAGPSVEVCQKFSQVLDVSFLWLLDGRVDRQQEQSSVLREDPTPYRVTPKPPQSDLAIAAQNTANAMQDMCEELRDLRCRVERLEQIIKKTEP